MKRLLIICMMTCGFIISSCHQDEDSLFTEVSIVLQGETDIVLDRVQGTVSLTNLNTTQVFTVSSFEGNIARASILRGSYAIQVEGTAQYHDASGKTYIRMFRASTDYVGLEKEGHNEAMLNIIWM